MSNKLGGISAVRVDMASSGRQSAHVDAVLADAARALDAGDVLSALKRVALRSDAPALGLRGVALARLGQFDRARELLRSAARAFGSKQPMGHARCLLADAEIALASRDLRGVEATLANVGKTLAAHGDSVNAAHAACLAAQSSLLRGRLLEAERALASLELDRAPAAIRAEVALAWAELHTRALDPNAARRALARAERAANSGRIAAFLSEIRRARARLAAPAARSLRAGGAALLGLAELGALLRRKDTLLVDARELTVRTSTARASLARRPVLFALARVLAEAWPHGAARAELVRRAFAAPRVNDSHRARLRVEIARLRRALRSLAAIDATAEGFALSPFTATEVAVVAPVFEDEHAALLALLEDGEAWSSSALAVALGESQRSVQRALLALETSRKVRATGRARAKRWLLAPGAGFATRLLLLPPFEIA